MITALPVVKTSPAIPAFAGMRISFSSLATRIQILCQLQIQPLNAHVARARLSQDRLKVNHLSARISSNTLHNEEINRTGFFQVQVA